MATFSQRKNGRWQAKIREKGYPVQSKTFASYNEAEDWSKLVEAEMIRGVESPPND